MSAGARRAGRLLRWYPRSWRDRYGEEFTELLLDELASRPRDWRRGADIALHGLLARLASAGLTSREQPAPAGMAAMAGALAVFCTLGAAMLAQLATGWQWASPGSATVTAATVIMTLAAACVAVLGLGAVVPVGWRVLAAFRRRDPRVMRPAAIAAACAAALVTGARHFQNGWPGTGGTGASHHLVPGGMAAFSWASTLSVSSFWAHPALLARFPAAELTWMAVSPAAGIALLVAAAVTVRRLSLPARLVRYLTRLARLTTGSAVIFLCGAVIWLAGERAGAGAGLFRPGLVDGAELLVMGLALTVALRLARTLSRALGRSAAVAGG
jgi:hypothetical protein